jgi:hypothetical protein
MVANVFVYRLNYRSFRSLLLALTIHDILAKAEMEYEDKVDTQCVVLPVRSGSQFVHNAIARPSFR